MERFCGIAQNLPIRRSNRLLKVRGSLTWGTMRFCPGFGPDQTSGTHNQKFIRFDIMSTQTLAVYPWIDTRHRYWKFLLQMVRCVPSIYADYVICESSAKFFNCKGIMVVFDTDTGSQLSVSGRRSWLDCTSCQHPRMASRHQCFYGSTENLARSMKRTRSSASPKTLRVLEIFADKFPFQ